MKSKTILCNILLCFPFLSAFSQNMKSLESVGIDQVTIIEIASQGDIWVGTMGAGLKRYDAAGNLITWFTRANNPLLASDTINAIALGPVGGVQYAFVGTPSGLSYCKAASTYAINTLLPSETNVTALALTAGDSLVSFSATGAAVLDTNHIRLSSLPLPFQHISCAEGMNDYSCLKGVTIGSVDSGVAFTTDYINYTTITTPDLVNDSVTAVYVDHGCTARFIGTRHGFSFCPVGHPCANFTTSNSALPDNYITAINQGCSGDVWIGTRSAGIAVFNPQAQSFTTITTANGLSTDSITAISFRFDSCSGVGYVGTADGNVAVVDSNRSVIKLVTGIQSVPNNSISVRIFPQPATSQVNFLFGAELQNERFNYTDITGRVLGSYDLKNVSNFALNVSELTTGLYLYQIYSSNGIVKSGKFEVVK